MVIRRQFIRTGVLTAGTTAMQSRSCFHLLLIVAVSANLLDRVIAQTEQATFKAAITADHPTIYWDFETSRLAPRISDSDARFKLTQMGN
ncbi:MAG: hypothetical protein VX438_17460, partial [Planctomycetota bacterium]|nr:hypothetical protein [Planctomycetota bacterium]